MTPDTAVTTQQVLADYEQYVQRTYGRIPLVFVRGEGAVLWDAEGRRFLDWVSGGRAGNALGHAHPHVVRTLQRQLETLTFVSNDYHHPWGARLGRLLAERSGGRKAFFCNSGAEASETAIKLARKWGRAQRGPECHEVVTFSGSFHGRTYGALSATGQTKFQQGFEPVVEGFRYAPWNDLDALRELVGPAVCAVFLEPVQGESGIHPASPAFLQGIQELCRERNILFMVDEVQTGFGRTGRFWAYEHAGVDPDVVTIAKALGGGIVIGACLAKPERCALVPGDHGCTFGGNPFSAAAACAAIEALEQEGLVARAAELGAQLLEGLRALLGPDTGVREARGLGLMLALEFDRPLAGAVASGCQERGLLLHTVGDTILRMLPPLILTREQAAEGLAALREAVRAASGATQ